MDAPGIILRKPIVQGPITYDHLDFRTPEGGDLCASGYPFKFGRTPEGDTIRLFDAPACTQLISRLAGIPLSAARRLDVRDWQDATEVIAGFFADAEDAATNGTDTPPS